MSNVSQTRAHSDAIYAAGFFDGEGCVNITKAKGHGKEPIYRLQVLLTNTNAAILDWFQERWGGKIYEVSNNRSNLTEYPRKCLSLVWTGRDAADVLQALEPEVKVKRDQLLNALAFQTIKDQTRRGQTTATDLRAKQVRHFEIHRRLSSRTNAPGAALEALGHDEADDQLELLS